MGAEINKEGLAELLQELDTLPVKLERRVIRAGLREGIKKIAAILGGITPVKTGALIKSIKITSRNKQGQPGARIRIGNKIAWYAHLLEVGTTRKPGGYWIRPKHAKSLFIAGLFRKAVFHPPLAGRHFAQRAFDQGSEPAVEAFKTYLDQKLPQELGKLARENQAGLNS